MGRKSTRENKNAYQVARENADLTREATEALCPALTADRIVKIENDRIQVTPEDVLLMSEYYKAPSLCNYYCANECPLGRGKVPEVESKELAQIAIETLNGLNRLNRDKERLLEIVEDGTVRPDERADFMVIKETMDKIDACVRTMHLWIEEAEASGKLPKNFLD